MFAEEWQDEADVELQLKLDTLTNNCGIDYSWQHVFKYLLTSKHDSASSSGSPVRQTGVL